MARKVQAQNVPAGATVLVDLSRQFDEDIVRCLVVEVRHIKCRSVHHSAGRKDSEWVEFRFAPEDGDGNYRFSYDCSDALTVVEFPTSAGE